MTSGGRSGEQGDGTEGISRAELFDFHLPPILQLMADLNHAGKQNIELSQGGAPCTTSFSPFWKCRRAILALRDFFSSALSGSKKVQVIEKAFLSKKMNRPGGRGGTEWARSPVDLRD